MHKHVHMWQLSCMKTREADQTKGPVTAVTKTDFFYFFWCNHDNKHKTGRLLPPRKTMSLSCTLETSLTCQIITKKKKKKNRLEVTNTVALIFFKETETRKLDTTKFQFERKARCQLRNNPRKSSLIGEWMAECDQQVSCWNQIGRRVVK